MNKCVEQEGKGVREIMWRNGEEEREREKKAEGEVKERENREGVVMRKGSRCE